MTTRKSKWFSIPTTGRWTEKGITYVVSTFNSGTGNTINEGVAGMRYTIALDDQDPDKVDAPNPPFTEEENIG